jgi:hypothetical protein
MNKQTVLASIGLLLFITVVGFIFWSNYGGNVVVVDTEPWSNENLVRVVDSRIRMAIPEVELPTEEIMVTDGVRHTIPINEIISGGPAKDGIPSIDYPKFTSVESAKALLDDDDPGIAVSIDGIDRFYPFQILVWHEVVNDMFNGRRVLITYCPLCRSGIVFDPTVFTDQVEFGVSGNLWNSNLLMYDRKTDSLWSQILGEAVVGEATGQTLPVLPSDHVRFGDWKAGHPDGEVLSRNTGIVRQYGYDPYGDYYTNPGIFFPVNYEDDRLEQKELVVGMAVDGQAKAYPIETIRKAGEIEDMFAGKTMILRYDDEVGAVRVFEKKVSEDSEAEEDILEPVYPVTSFWFAWVAIHPRTDLFL